MNEEGQQGIDQIASDQGDAAHGEGPPNSQSGETWIPASKVEHLIRERLARDRQARGGSGRQDRQAAPAGQPPQQQASQGGSVFSEASALNLYITLDKIAEADKVNIPVSAKQRMIEAYSAIRPSDAEAWARDWIKDFGLAAAKVETPQPQPSNQTHQQSVGSPAISNSNVPSPSYATEPSEDTPPWKLQGEQLDRLLAKHGPLGTRKLVEAFSRHMKTTRVVMTPKRS